MNIDFNEFIQKIHSNSKITKISDPVNLISYGSPNEANTSAEVDSVFAHELKIIFFLVFTENYDTRVLAVSSFLDHDNYMPALAEIKTKCILISQKPISSYTSKIEKFD